MHRCMHDCLMALLTSSLSGLWLQVVLTLVPPSTLPAPLALLWCLPATLASPSATFSPSSLVGQLPLELQYSCMAGHQSAVQHQPGVDKHCSLMAVMVEHCAGSAAGKLQEQAAGAA